jgi:hypothetical protein
VFLPSYSCYYKNIPLALTKQYYTEFVPEKLSADCQLLDSAQFAIISKKFSPNNQTFSLIFAGFIMTQVALFFARNDFIANRL